jgi:hypothetical protein
MRPSSGGLSDRPRTADHASAHHPHLQGLSARCTQSVSPIDTPAGASSARIARAHQPIDVGALGVSFVVSHDSSGSSIIVPIVNSCLQTRSEAPVDTVRPRDT